MAAGDGNASLSEAGRVPVVKYQAATGNDNNSMPAAAGPDRLVRLQLRDFDIPRFIAKA